MKISMFGPVATQTGRSPADATGFSNKPTVATFRTGEVVLLILWLVACSAAVFSRSFSLPYAFDDLDHLHALTTLLTGQISPSVWLFHNHNEHIVPMVRLYYWTAVRLGGFNARSIHMMMFVTYVVGAIGCAWASFSLTRSRVAAFLAGTIYAGAAGFSGSIVWVPNQFSIVGSPLIFAMAILVSPYVRKQWSILIVLVLVLISSMGMGAAALLALSIPIYLYLANPESIAARQRNIFIIVSLLFSILILLATRWIMASHGITHAVSFTGQGVLAGLFLIFTAPGRFLLAWTPTGELGVPMDIAVSLVGWILLAITWRWVTKAMRVFLVSLWIAESLLTLLVGLSRYKEGYLVLFITDRYYYYFLFPLALQTGAVLSPLIARALAAGGRFQRITVTCILGCTLALLLGMSFLRLDKSMYWNTIKDHRRGFREAKVLANILKSRAAQGNIHLADGPIRFPGVHKEHIALACVVFTQFPRGLPGITWTFSTTPPTNVGFPWNVPPISDADAAVENQILDEWDRLEKRPPYSCVIGGHMQDVTDPAITSCAQAANAPDAPTIDRSDAQSALGGSAR